MSRQFTKTVCVRLETILPWRGGGGAAGLCVCVGGGGGGAFLLSEVTAGHVIQGEVGFQGLCVQTAEQPPRRPMQSSGAV